MGNRKMSIPSSKWVAKKFYNLLNSVICSMPESTKNKQAFQKTKSVIFFLMGEDKQGAEKQKAEHVINRNKITGIFRYSRYSKTPP